MTDLHLPSLSIQSFRGIDQLSIPKLGRVTLLAGKNGVGKTTVLDAVRVYAARGRYQALHDLLAVRQEFTAPSHEQRNRIHGLEWSSLFHGRITTAGAHISIGLTNGAGQLAITYAKLTPEQSSSLARTVRNEDIPRHGLKITFGDREQVLWGFLPISADSVHRIQELDHRRMIDDGAEPPEIACHSLGPELPTTEDISRFWDRIALTDHRPRT